MMIQLHSSQSALLSASAFSIVASFRCLKNYIFLTSLPVSLSGLVGIVAVPDVGYRLYSHFGPLLFISIRIIS